MFYEVRFISCVCCHRNLYTSKPSTPHDVLDTRTISPKWFPQSTAKFHGNYIYIKLLYTYFYLISSKVLIANMPLIHLFIIEATTRLLRRRKLFIERSQRTRVISS